MKKKSVIIIIIASLGIIGSELLVLFNDSLFGHRMLAISFILLGIGAMLLGINQLKTIKNGK